MKNKEQEKRERLHPFFISIFATHVEAKLYFNFQYHHPWRLVIQWFIHHLFAKFCLLVASPDWAVKIGKQERTRHKKGGEAVLLIPLSRFSHTYQKRTSNPSQPTPV